MVQRRASELLIIPVDIATPSVLNDITCVSLFDFFKYQHVFHISLYFTWLIVQASQIQITC